MIANARMYSVNATAAAAWRDLLGWVLSHAQLDCTVVDHPAPAPMAQLWSRDDLGAALMCGLPYTLRAPTPVLIAAPVPAPSRYQGRAAYMTDLAVRADSPFQRIEDTFGHRIGYTVADSQSGYFALRRFLVPFHARHEGPLFQEVVGGLLNARGVIDALASGAVDVGPLDSYSHDLLRHLEPETARTVRVIASTPLTAIPPFVATAPLAPFAVARLRAAFLAAGAAPGLAGIRDTLLLRDFVVPVPADYAPIRASHDALIGAPEVW